MLPFIENLVSQQFILEKQGKCLILSFYFYIFKTMNWLSRIF